MIRDVVPFKRWHYAWLADQGPAVDQIGDLAMNKEVLATLEAHNTWTGVVEGEPIAVAGTMLLWPGRHMAWAHMTPATGPHMLWITQATLKNLEQVKGRVELTVRADFIAGHRWAKMLGFLIETPCLKQYGPTGEDHVGYARIG
jgi:hypothetical protein